MIINNINHNYGYGVEKICFQFFPLEKINTKTETDKLIINTEICGDNIYVTVFLDGKEYSNEGKVESNPAKDILKVLYELLIEICGYKPPWGILYGVRPLKLFEYYKDKYDFEAVSKFKNNNLISEKRVELLSKIYDYQEPIIERINNKDISIYISIPFCPNRCSYCSFVSHSIEFASDYMDEYSIKICEELDSIFQIVKKNELNVKTVYIGGGTPTSLSTLQLQRILNKVYENLNVDDLEEFTVEAGRPDTIDEEKLKLLKDFHVTRISINPQTLNEDVLLLTGRKHTVKDFYDTYNLAREIGFNNINMDLIAGLDGDTYNSFIYTVNECIKLNPESITIHSLALKSASYLKSEGKNLNFTKQIEVKNSVDDAYDILENNNYLPYYLYRQSKSIGSLENIGFCKNNKESRYNIYMMDETSSVLSVGAGAVTLLSNGKRNEIERVYNFKYPYEYLNNFEEIISRKSIINDYINKINL